MQQVRRIITPASEQILLMKLKHMFPEGEVQGWYDYCLEEINCYPRPTLGEIDEIVYQAVSKAKGKL